MPRLRVKVPVEVDVSDEQFELAQRGADVVGALRQLHDAVRELPAVATAAQAIERFAGAVAKRRPRRRR